MSETITLQEMKTEAEQKEELFTHATTNWGITNDAVKERIWNYVASLQSDLLSLNSNLLTMAENVNLVVKERNRYKEALDGVTNLIQKEIWTCKQEIAVNVDPQINAEWANAYNYLLTKLQQ